MQAEGSRAQGWQPLAGSSAAELEPTQAGGQQTVGAERRRRARRSPAGRRGRRRRQRQWREQPSGRRFGRGGGEGGEHIAPGLGGGGRRWSGGDPTGQRAERPGGVAQPESEPEPQQRQPQREQPGHRRRGGGPPGGALAQAAVTALFSAPSRASCISSGRGECDVEVGVWWATVGWVQRAAGLAGE